MNGLTEWIGLAALAATNLVVVTLAYARIREENASLSARLLVLEAKLGNGHASFARSREVEIVQESNERRIARLELLVRVEKTE